MGRAASPETENRRLRAELKSIKRLYAEAHSKWSRETGRAQAAEKDRDEWKTRFDQLLQQRTTTGA